MHRWLGGLAVVGAVAGTGGPAVAIEIVGGTTTIGLEEEVASVLAERLGAEVGVIGGATWDPETATATLPVTGGDSVDGTALDATIEHAGHGLSLATDGTLLEVEDLVVGTSDGTLGGVLRATTPLFTSAIEIPLEFAATEVFAFTPNVEEGGLDIGLTTVAADTLNRLFGIDTLGPDIRIATATSELELAEPVETPLPAALPLLAAGVGGLAWAARRRRKAA
jgi:hypothetical protein